MYVPRKALGSFPESCGKLPRAVQGRRALAGGAYDGAVLHLVPSHRHLVGPIHRGDHSRVAHLERGRPACRHDTASTPPGEWREACPCQIPIVYNGRESDSHCVQWRGIRFPFCTMAGNKIPIVHNGRGSDSHCAQWADLHADSTMTHASEGSEGDIRKLGPTAPDVI